MVCTECPAFIATRNNDDILRKEIAEKWSEKLNYDFKPEDINCDGGCLLKDGRVMKFCLDCPIRNCAQARGVKNCAWCGDYSCEKTDEFFKLVPEAEKTLDAIKQGIFK